MAGPSATAGCASASGSRAAGCGQQEKRRMRRRKSSKLLVGDEFQAECPEPTRRPAELSEAERALLGQVVHAEPAAAETAGTSGSGSTARGVQRGGKGGARAETGGGASSSAGKASLVFPTTQAIAFKTHQKLDAQPALRLRHVIMDASVQELDKKLGSVGVVLGMSLMGSKTQALWQPKDECAFACGVGTHDREFELIQRDFLPHKTMSQLIAYYYNVWKIRYTPEAEEWHAQKSERQAQGEDASSNEEEQEAEVAAATQRPQAQMAAATTTGKAVGVRKEEQQSGPRAQSAGTRKKPTLKKKKKKQQGQADRGKVGVKGETSAPRPMVQRQNATARSLAAAPVVNARVPSGFAKQRLPTSSGRMQLAGAAAEAGVGGRVAKKARVPSERSLSPSSSAAMTPVSSGATADADVAEEHGRVAGHRPLQPSRLGPGSSGLKRAAAESLCKGAGSPPAKQPRPRVSAVTDAAESGPSSSSAAPAQTQTPRCLSPQQQQQEGGQEAQGLDVAVARYAHESDWHLQSLTSLARLTSDLERVAVDRQRRFGGAGGGGEDIDDAARKFVELALSYSAAVIALAAAKVQAEHVVLARTQKLGADTRPVRQRIRELMSMQAEMRGRVEVLREAVRGLPGGEGLIAEADQLAARKQGAARDARAQQEGQGQGQEQEQQSTRLDRRQQQQG